MEKEFIGKGVYNSLPIYIDVIIPTFNQSEFITDAVVSIINQSYSFINIYVVDDSTNEDTGEICKTMNYANLTYIKNKKRLGRVKNYQNCLYNISTSTFLMILDGDDYLTDNNYIEYAVNKFIEFPDLALVFGRINQKNEYNIQGFNNDLTLDKFSSGIISGNDYLFKHYNRSIPLVHLSIVFNTKKAKEINFYNFNSIGCELESFFRLVLNNKIFFFNKTIGTWRIHQKNQSLTKNINEIITDSKYIISVKRYMLISKIDLKLATIWYNRMILYHIENYVYLLSCNKPLMYGLIFRYLINYPLLTFNFIFKILESRLPFNFSTK